MRRLVAAALVALSLGLSSAAVAQQPLVIKPLTETRVSALPEGALYWRVDRFESADAARAAAGPWSLVAESAGRIWLFTLGPKDASVAGGNRVAEVGPIPRVTAGTYLLRINEASGPPGSVTPVHSHPGSEAFFVLSGQQSIRGLHGVLRVDAGRSEAGHGADMAMQVSSTGTEDLHALVMFVVDAARPFSSPATLP